MKKKGLIIVALVLLIIIIAGIIIVNKNRNNSGVSDEESTESSSPVEETSEEATTEEITSEKITSEELAQENSSLLYSYNEYSKQLGENFLDEYFNKRILENTDLTSMFPNVGHNYVEVSLIDDAPNQRVEVYTGMISERDGGFVVVRDSENKVICCKEAVCINAGFNSIYLGKTESGEDFLITVQLDDREFHGEYIYSVFRIGKDGEKEEIAGSVYEWDHGYEEHSIENCEECQLWQKEVDKYLNNSILLLSTQDFKYQIIGE